MGKPNIIDDSLVVIAHKIGRRLFDLSTDLDDYSIRDQIVRAAMFANGLIDTGACKEGNKVLIVGAGIAGITCGAALASHGIGVRVLEASDSPFSIFKEARHRYVGPFMYEWPNIVSESHSFPSVTDQSFRGVSHDTIPDYLPHWEAQAPLSGPDLFRKLMVWLDRFLSSDAGKSLKLFTEVSRSATREFVLAYAQDILQWESSLAHGGRLYLPGREEIPKDPTAFVSVRDVQFAILAAGAPKEQLSLHTGVSTKPFWEDDTATMESSKNRDIAVFGNADGAFQDFLRYSFATKHPMEMHEKFPLNCRKAIRQKFSSLLSPEIAAKRLLTWGFVRDGTGIAQLHCDAVVASLLSNDKIKRQFIVALGRMLKKGSGSVTLVRSKTPPKGFLLNRFLVTLVESLRDELNEIPKKFKIHFCYHMERLTRLERELNGESLWKNPVANPPDGVPSHFYRTIVRYGFDSDNDSLGRTVTASIEPTDAPARVCFSSIGLPFNPPGGEDNHLGKTEDTRKRIRRKLQLHTA